MTQTDAISNPSGAAQPKTSTTSSKQTPVKQAPRNLTPLAQAIRQSDLDKKDAMADLLRDSLLISRYPADPHSGDAFVSRFGGIPDLPRNLDWPHHQGVPLACVGQINLGELPEFSGRKFFPEDGMLYFFYDSTKEAEGYHLAEASAFAVLYAETGTTGRPWAEIKPPALGALGVYVPARMIFEVQESFPDSDNIFFFSDAPAPPWHISPMDELGFDSETKNAYYHLMNQFLELEGHRIWGYPASINERASRVCEQLRHEREGQAVDDATLAKGMKEWELLLQVGSDEELGMYWPNDMGILYYMIRRSDLVARRFDQVWMIKQYS